MGKDSTHSTAQYSILIFNNSQKKLVKSYKLFTTWEHFCFVIFLPFIYVFLRRAGPYRLNDSHLLTWKSGMVVLFCHLLNSPLFFFEACTHCALFPFFYVKPRSCPHPLYEDSLKNPPLKYHHHRFVFHVIKLIIIISLP